MLFSAACLTSKEGALAVLRGGGVGAIISGIEEIMKHRDPSLLKTGVTALGRRARATEYGVTSCRHVWAVPHRPYSCIRAAGAHASPSQQRVNLTPLSALPSSASHLPKLLTPPPNCPHTSRVATTGITGKEQIIDDKGPYWLMTLMKEFADDIELVLELVHTLGAPATYRV